MFRVIRRVDWSGVVEGVFLVAVLPLSLGAVVWLAVHGGPRHF
jgi:hypothetical protein